MTKKVKQVLRAHSFYLLLALQAHFRALRVLPRPSASHTPAIKTNPIKISQTSHKIWPQLGVHLQCDLVTLTFDVGQI